MIIEKDKLCKIQLKIQPVVVKVRNVPCRLRHLNIWSPVGDNAWRLGKVQH